MLSYKFLLSHLDSVEAHEYQKNVFICHRHRSIGLGKYRMQMEVQIPQCPPSSCPSQRLCRPISVQKKKRHCCSSHPIRPKDLIGKSNIGTTAYFNSSKNCSTCSSSVLRKFLSFCVTAFSGVCCWRKISEILDEPPPFHARI